MWVWIGSSSFVGYEEGLDPWQVANDDFKTNSQWQIYIFSVYWVCTVVTTVGYGDYYGGTTLEYNYTICLEFLGLVVFSVLQVAVHQVVDHDASFENYIAQMDEKITVWLNDLEKANFRKPLPTDIYETIKADLWPSFQNDPCLIKDEFDFYQHLSPQLQDILVKKLFGNIIDTFSDFLNGCERLFINNLVVSSSYNFYSHGYVI